MNEQELNKKLAEWAGFEWKTLTWKMSRGFPNRDFTGWWKGDNFKTELNFTQSLDACFKWLVPLAIDKIMAEQECSSDLAYAILFKKWLQELELIIPEAALALCRAIDKLIDSEKKDE